MRDPSDAIDEAYGRWLGSSGYADMKSYRDVFRDGWRAGGDYEARNCPQEGRIVALKAENERLNGLLQKRVNYKHCCPSLITMSDHTDYCLAREATITRQREEIERLHQALDFARGTLGDIGSSSTTP